MSNGGRPSGAHSTLLPDGRRLHLQHGPIDLIIGADGPEAEIRRAYDQARDAFMTVLDALVAELPQLRTPIDPAHGIRLNGTIARRMQIATKPFAPAFITPMAAVAGSVADHILSALCDGRDLTRAYVNNGGDIALHLAQGSFRVGICENPITGQPGGIAEIRAGDGIGGIATSGWRGRSHSLGIADAVTVLAPSAAAADAAATMIANQVDLPFSPLVTRKPAQELSPDSDLGRQLVTTDVAPLERGEARAALSRGKKAAEEYLARELLVSAYLGLSGERLTVHRAQIQKQTQMLGEIHA